MKDQSYAPNYIKIMNWAWEEIPYMDGYKSSHMILFMAIIDSINRNRWEETSIPFEMLLSKTRLSKETYLSSRAWLIKHKLISVEVGKNAYQMAKFNIGVAVGIPVENTTTTPTGEPATIVEIPVENKTGNPTLYKTVNNVVKQKTLNIPFDDFYALYDKKIGEPKCRRLWAALSDAEREKAMAHIPDYKRSTEDRKFRKDPERYLRYKAFNDEIIINGKHSQHNQVRTFATGERKGL